MITLGLVDSVDDNGVYVTMPGSRGVLRGPYKALSTVAAGTTVLVASTDDGEQGVVGAAPSGDGFVSVMSFGAKGDGATDDTEAIQAAVDAAAGVGTVLFPAGTFLITARVTLPAESVLVGVGAEIVQQTAGTAGLRIVGSDVTVSGLSITGRHETSTYVNGEDGIQTDTTVGSPLERIRIDRCRITGWGKYGIWMEHVNRFWVTDCVIDEVGYSGGSFASCTFGQVCGNSVSNVTAGASGNAYGFAATRITTDDANPRSTDISFTNNRFHTIKWEGLDTHGGERIIFDGNTLTACDRGIAAVSADDELGDATFAPLDCVITGNTIDSLSDSGGKACGVVLSGADVSGEYATGVIANNTITGHGGTTVLGGVVLQHSKGVVVAGNKLAECNAYGVSLDVDNVGALVASNTFVDVWSSSAYTAGVIVVDSSSVTVTGNVLVDGDKSATHLNESGIYDFGGAAAGNTVYAYGNDFSAATDAEYKANTTPSDVLTSLGHAGGKVGFFGAAAGAKPTITGSRGGNAALQSLLTELATLGLITDSSS